MKKRNVINILLLMALLVPGLNVYALDVTTNYVNSNGINMNKNQINNLKSLGFTENQISNMDINEFNSNKILFGQIADSSTKYIKSTYIYKLKKDSRMSYYDIQKTFSTSDKIDQNDNLEFVKVENQEITEEEFDDAKIDDSHIYVTRGANPNIHETSYKKLTTSIIHLSNGRYRLKNDLYWKTIPSNRSYDISAIGINNSVAEPVSGSHYAKQTYTTQDSCKLTVSYTKEFYNGISSWQRGASGYGVNFLLPSNIIVDYPWDEFLGTYYPCVTGSDNRTRGVVHATVSVIALESYMYFEVAKVGMTSPLSAYGSYQHSVSSLSWNISHSFTVGLGGNLGYSIDVQPSYVTYYDGMAGTHAQILNPAW